MVDCCMAQHANAVPPWRCSCPCHTQPVAREQYVTLSTELVDDIKSVLDNYQDVNDGDDGRPVANRAMSVLQRLNTEAP